MLLPFFNCFSSPKQFKDLLGATSSFVGNCMSNSSLKVLEEENVLLVIFLPKFSVHFDTAFRAMSYRKCLSTDEKPKGFPGLNIG